MAGHSQFKNIMFRKGAQDKKRGKLFTKATREIMVAVKESGAELESNARLRAAILGARAVNMPKENIERAIKKASGDQNDVQYMEVRYEGYGSGGVAVIVEALTDNRNRTASDVRSLFTRYGGNLGEINSVAFQFEHIGEIEFPISIASTDTIFDYALACSAQDIITTEMHHTIITERGQFHTVSEALTQKFGDLSRAEISWRPLNTVPVTEDQMGSLLKLIDALEDLDDVQSVHTNFEIDQSILQKMDQA